MRAITTGLAVVGLLLMGPETTVADVALPSAGAEPAATPGLEAFECRTLDGAGLERQPPKNLMLGEEPDLLCRALVKLPANIVPRELSLTLSVRIGRDETWTETRAVRAGPKGFRAMVLLVPEEALWPAPDEEREDMIATVVVTLSGGATPTSRKLSFRIHAPD